jgi:hypothetical protein
MRNYNHPQRCDGVIPGVYTRRQMLKTLTTGFGYMAFAGLATQHARAASPDANQAATADSSLLLPKQPHFAPRAKRIIFLGMEGAPSHVDTFDYKVKLQADDGKQSKDNEDRQYLGSPFKFKQYGQSGKWISELFPNIASHADELCFLHGMWTNVPPLHPQAWPALHTGSPVLVRPSMGSWLLYGLGTENQNLPGFVTIKPALSIGGGQSYESAFLPTVFSATRIGESKTDINNCSINNIKNANLTASVQRKELDFVQQLNHNLLKKGTLDHQVEGVIQSYELAFKMQGEVPEVTDISKESQATLDLYGINKDETDDFGRQCLLARRFAEAGVRFIEVCYDDWDHHGQLYAGLKKSTRAVDQPISALLTDLHQRGMLKTHLCCGAANSVELPTVRNRMVATTAPKAGQCGWLAAASNLVSPTARPTITASMPWTAKWITTICTRRCCTSSVWTMRN